MESPFITVKETAEFLRVKEITLRHYISKSVIPYYKLNGKILFKISDLEQLLESNRHASHDEEFHKSMKKVLRAINK
ncbi:MAG: helix-turn-helix domain-containing protein [bacterium]